MEYFNELDAKDDLLEGRWESAEQPVTTSPFLVVEEHAKRQDVAPSILAAVMQSEGWRAGKKITETAFKDAVSAFVGAPIGGR
jgi:hypothetical protein